MAQTSGHAPSPGLLSPSSGQPLRAGPIGNPTSPRAAGRGKGESTSAIDAALAQIAAAFGLAAEIKDFKLQVARWLRLGPQHPAVHARFRARAAALPAWRLDGAIREVECWWREERKSFALASALGYGSRLSVETLRELRLILRLLRRKRLAAEFAAIAAAVCEQEMTMAAE
ncbi:MAG: hypothetical protein ACTHJS_03535 [Xanthobacteraceae bacterium]